MPLTKNAVKYLKQYLKTRDDDYEVLFKSRNKNDNYKLSRQQVWAIIHELGESVDEHLYPHKYRRTFCTEIVNRGLKLEQAQKIIEVKTFADFKRVANM